MRHLMSVGNIDVSRLGDHMYILLVRYIDNRKRILVEAETNLMTSVSVRNNNDSQTPHYFYKYAILKNTTADQSRTIPVLVYL